MGGGGGGGGRGDWYRRYNVLLTGSAKCCIKLTTCHARARCVPLADRLTTNSIRFSFPGMHPNYDDD